MCAFKMAFMGKADKGWALRSPSIINLEKRDSRLKWQSLPLAQRLGSFVYVG